jgi:hypothetical protein
MRLVEWGLLLCIPLARAAENPRLVAVIAHVDGSAYRRQSPDAKPVQLDRDRDQFRKLFEGERVGCLKECRIVLILTDGSRKDVRPRDRWFRPRPAAAISRGRGYPDGPNREAWRRALADFAESTGTPRGESRFLTPIEGSAIVADRFVIRWKAQRFTAPLAVTILGDGQPIWTQNVVDPLPSEIVSTNLQSILAQRAASDLTLRVISPDDRIDEVHFSVLSKDDEGSLSANLESWDRQAEGVLNHIGRASVFSRSRLYWDAAEEYEAALRIAPRSRDLLLAAIEANRRAMNLSRVSELSNLLDPR